MKTKTKEIKRLTGGKRAFIEAVNEAYRGSCNIINYVHGAGWFHAHNSENHLKRVDPFGGLEVVGGEFYIACNWNTDGDRWVKFSDYADYREGILSVLNANEEDED